MKTYNGKTIPVIGVGDAGCNAVNYNFNQQVRNVHLVASNIDAGSLSKSPILNKLLLSEMTSAEYVSTGCIHHRGNVLLNSS